MARSRVCYIRHQIDYDLQDIVNDAQHLFGDVQVQFLVWIVFSLLAMASSASAASAGPSMISTYISQVRAELRRQRPEAREAWLKAEMNSMQLGSSHEGKPSVRDVCRHLNMAVSQEKGKLDKKTLVKNLVKKLSLRLESCQGLPWFCFAFNGFPDAVSAARLGTK